MATKAMQPTKNTWMVPGISMSLFIKGITYSLHNKIQKLIASRGYEILVVSFLLLIFGDTFHHSPILAVLLPLQNMLAAMIVFFSIKHMRIAISIMITLVITLALINCCYYTKQVSAVICIICFLYFVLISFKVYQKIFTARSVSTEMIAAVICGFILLCLTGAILFITIEVNYPSSYTNIALGVHRFQNLVYFSFTTLLTIGYGDIVPVTLLAKRSVMLIGLAGHIYTVFLTGIIIGKYIQSQPKKCTVHDKI